MGGEDLGWPDVISEFELDLGTTKMSCVVLVTGCSTGGIGFAL